MLNVTSFGESEVDSRGWFDDPPKHSDTIAHEPKRPTYLHAINVALDDSLASDRAVVLLGEDIGEMGGAFRVTAGLLDKYGPDRVIDTPMSESAIVGAAIGMAVEGLKPIVELQFADFISCAYDQLVTQAAKLHYRFGIAVPMVVRAPSGGGVGAGPFHSQSPEGIFAHIPGLKVVCPGSVQDAYDLMRAAVHDPNPVIFFEHKALYRSLRGELVRRLPPANWTGNSKRVRLGRDVTIVTYGAMVRATMQAAVSLSQQGIDAEVLDIMSISPLDTEPILRSVEKTSRLVVVHEDTISGGIGAEIAARVSGAAFFFLDAPIVRIAAPDTPVPLARTLEEAYIPSVARITDGVIACVRV
ncbi:MAG: alpha-ketoacid dehydrogenase subunit beta [Acidobacteria bacterium]|nr:alpha-ketoacid dehydrogenase subunit beta [Acidobacteriota bacterium]